MAKLSGKKLAKEIGCARSTLSEATDQGYLVDGRWDVQEWAVCTPSGRVKHYDVPDRVAFLNREDRKNPVDLPNPGDSAPSADSPTPDLKLPALNAILEDHEKTTRKVAEESGDRTQLVSDETDVQGTARNVGMAYAAGEAIEYDTPGARAFWTVASALAGGLGGYAVTDESPWGALFGALSFGGVGYLAYEQQPRQQDPGPRCGERSGQDDLQNGASEGRRSRAVSLSRAHSR